jgi:phosphoribosyl-AMP cyclohydrolase
MQRHYFKALEQADVSLPLELAEVLSQLPFNEQGLLPVITQDVTSKKVLMLAWMNKVSLCQTLQTKRMTYWSRSRESLWVKGETSGHTQSLKSIAFDCDGDAILCQVEQIGAACHTGRTDCFYLQVDLDQSRIFIRGKGH